MPTAFYVSASACAIMLAWSGAQWRRLKRTPAIDDSSSRRGIEAASVQAGPYRMFFRFARPASRPARQPAPPPVVLVHGLVVSSRYMEPLAQILARDFDVFAPDLPGFGESRLARSRDALSVPELADALRLWLAACEIECATFVGNSFGCQVLADFASRYPRAVARLVLPAPTPDPRAPSLREQAWRAFVNGRREQPRSPAAVGRIDYAKAGLWRAFATMRMLVRDPFSERLARTAAPTLVVAGTRDPVSPPDWAAHVAQQIPHASLTTIEGGTHTLNYAYPHAFAFAIAPFLQARPQAVQADECMKTQSSTQTQENQR
ncbi:alpha/beta fold hydrolase [Paraburkholderia sacchari]|uniref:alpha/beta fold hydrolase n=1 Tax=Paraburkholderia sacchari TaxID=159450 RepID=UPI000A43F08B|nr:alpha/beta hydrolase [Paraburkholderia sacchari]